MLRKKGRYDGVSQGILCPQFGEKDLNARQIRGLVGV